MSTAELDPVFPSPTATSRLKPAHVGQSPEGMPRTLAQAIAPHAISFDVLETRYQPMLRLERELIGVVPSCDPVLEIWPVAFRSYNLLVPSFLHLPSSLFGLGAPKDLVGLAMYTSSRAAECAYCSAHCCSFALRRGATAQSVVSQRTPVEAAVISVAEGLSRLPHELPPEEVARLREHMSEKHIVRVVASVALMGFLNKFMDAMGIELEPESIGDVAQLIGSTGWSPGQHQWAEASVEGTDKRPPVDSLSTLLRIVRLAPGAIRLERSWTKAVPSDPALANRYLLERTGIECSVLSELPDPATVRALATVLASNLDAEQTRTGLISKGLAGLVYAGVSGNAELGELARNIVRSAAAKDSASLQSRPDADFPDGELDAIESLAMTPVEQADWSTLAGLAADPARLAVVKLAHAVSTSPARVSGQLVAETCETLSPAEIVETVCWISINQMLHRLHVFRRQASP